ncbi:hypothetical protein N9A28_07225 [Sulfurimonas sp.]|nr:hypothetical protein [Sulfurimonas sp.]
MKKHILIIGFLSALMFNGCSYFNFNWAVCDKVAGDPHRNMPRECRNYNEEDATKAFNNTKGETETPISQEDALEFKEK